MTIDAPHISFRPACDTETKIYYYVSKMIANMSMHVHAYVCFCCSQASKSKEHASVMETCKYSAKNDGDGFSGRQQGWLPYCSYGFAKSRAVKQAASELSEPEASRAARHPNCKPIAIKE